ncbi:hypothetical protein D9757_001176 [Collybiopsis confluens]|uniref:Enoyl reductase (ER) domain-containing protein n=1 Tax=Collybiopsis confluens TaxID=2823264 RepID=A0A8H5I150_9AGAR|nr:hypothetical protein D9757_001176 [Collybiopsis confluens]
MPSNLCLPETIKALQIQPDKTLQLVEIPFSSQLLVQDLPEDQLIIRVRAVDVNPTDLRHAMGRWHAPGHISGCDGAGDVVKVGSAVKHLKVGDRAAGFTFGGSYQRDNGSYSEYVRFVATVCFKIPESMTYEEAAAFPVVHLTAMQALYMRLKIPQPLNFRHGAEDRQSILIWGGSTATGHHAVQLAALSGLRVFVTASPAVHDELKALGAEACFDYRDGVDVGKLVLAATHGQGVNFGLDCIVEGGSTDACVDAISPSKGGRIIVLRGPISTETRGRRKDVEIELILVYTLIGFPINFGGIIQIPAIPADAVASLEYITAVLPHLLEGWKQGKGSPALKGPRLRLMPGGLENIYKGMEIMRDGKYGREKLVYTVA